MAPAFWPAFRDQPRDGWPDWAIEFTETLIDILEVAMSTDRPLPNPPTHTPAS